LSNSFNWESDQEERTAGYAILEIVLERMTARMQEGDVQEEAKMEERRRSSLVVMAYCIFPDRSRLNVTPRQCIEGVWGILILEGFQSSLWKSKFSTCGADHKRWNVRSFFTAMESPRMMEQSEIMSAFS
jgi:hypothetical protein